MLVLTFGIAGFALAGGSSAHAATFCVQDPACVTGGGLDQTSVQAAFDAGVANGPGLDTVKIGPTPTPIPGGYADGAVKLSGAGAAQTKLTGTAGKILDLRSAASTVQDVGIVMAGNASGGLDTDGAATRVTVTGSTTYNGSNAITIGGGTSSGLNIDIDPSFTFTAGVWIQPTVQGVPGVVTLEDSKISAGIGGLFFGGQVPIVLRQSGRPRFVRGAPDRLLPSGHARQHLRAGRFLRLSPTAAALDVGGQSSHLTARHLTLVGPGTGNGISASATCSGGPVSVDVDISNSIIRGFATDFKTTGANACAATATVDIAHSIFDPAKVTTVAPGGVTPGPGNLNVDPLFADAASGNFALSTGSPAIDSGNPAGLDEGDGLSVDPETATDRAGNPRIADGNDDGAARTDMGALEVQPPVKPPVITDVARRMSFGYSTKKKTFSGELDAEGRDCNETTVEVFRAAKGKKKDKRIGSAETNDDGEFSLKKKAKKGKYFAVAAESTVGTIRCLTAQSKTLKVK